MKGNTKHALLFPVLVCYVAFLVIAAWPPPLRPGVLEGLSKGALRGFQKASLIPGIAVFTPYPRDREPRWDKVLYRCLIVQAVGRDGKLRVLYPVRPCPAPGFRWAAYAYDVMWIQMLSKSLYSSNPFRRRITRQATADFFCRSRLLSREQPREVLLTLSEGLVNYFTGLKTHEDFLFYRMNCAAGFERSPL